MTRREWQRKHTRMMLSLTRRERRDLCSTSLRSSS